MKSFISKVYKIFSGFMQRLYEDHVAVYAGHAAFFLIISGFPLIMLILSLIKYTPVSQADLLRAATNILPSSMDPMAESIINEMYKYTSGTIISVTAILTLWAASRGVMSIVLGIDNVYKIRKRPNMLLVRIISTLYTLLFVVGIVLSMVLMGFGNQLIGAFEKYAPILYDLAEWIISLRIIYIPVILAFIFVILYKIIGNKEYSVGIHLPGAIFAAFGWMASGWFYSLYIDNFAGRTYTYGSLTTVVLLMLWMYSCTYMLFIGAEINVYFKNYVLYIRRKAKKKVKQNIEKHLHN